MVWQDFLFCALLIMIMRVFSVFGILEGAQKLVLRSKNSISAIRKTKKEANKWSRISSLCFWNAKAEREITLKFLICIRIIAIITWPTSLVTAFLVFFDNCFVELARDVFLANAFFEIFINFILGSYFAVCHKRRML